MDAQRMCEEADRNESSNILATIVSIVFLLYIGVTIALASLQIYSLSVQPDTPTPTLNRASQPIASKTEVAAQCVIAGAARRRKLFVKHGDETGYETAVSAARSVLPATECMPLVSARR